MTDESIFPKNEPIVDNLILLDHAVDQKNLITRESGYAPLKEYYNDILKVFMVSGSNDISSVSKVLYIIYLD